MTAHHLIKERDTATQCPYCGEKFDMKKWRSAMHLQKHYKENVCSCGRTIRLTVDFCGSGHDRWAEKIAREVDEHSLEEKVNGK